MTLPRVAETEVALWRTMEFACWTFYCRLVKSLAVIVLLELCRMFDISVHVFDIYEIFKSIVVIVLLKFCRMFDISVHVFDIYEILLIICI